MVLDTQTLAGLVDSFAGALRLCALATNGVLASIPGAVTSHQECQARQRGHDFGATVAQVSVLERAVGVGVVQVRISLLPGSLPR